MKFRAAIHCQGCGRNYRSRAKEGREPVKRCKHKDCRSSRTIVHPSPEDEPDFDIPVRYIPVRDN